jgi:hypothetical protein
MSDAFQQAIEALVNSAGFFRRQGLDIAADSCRSAIESLKALQSGEPVAVAGRGVLNWIDGKQFAREADLYTAPQPVVPPHWRFVMRGMVEYAECNDPGNPYLDQAQALLSAGKETV